MRDGNHRTLPPSLLLSAQDVQFWSILDDDRFRIDIGRFLAISIKKLARNFASSFRKEDVAVVSFRLQPHSLEHRLAISYTSRQEHGVFTYRDGTRQWITCWHDAYTSRSWFSWGDDQFQIDIYKFLAISRKNIVKHLISTFRNSRRAIRLKGWKTHGLFPSGSSSSYFVSM